MKKRAPVFDHVGMATPDADADHDPFTERVDLAVSPAPRLRPLARGRLRKARRATPRPGKGA